LFSRTQCPFFFFKASWIVGDRSGGFHDSCPLSGKLAFRKIVFRARFACIRVEHWGLGGRHPPPHGVYWSSPSTLDIFFRCFFGAPNCLPFTRLPPFPRFYVQLLFSSQTSFRNFRLRDLSPFHSVLAFFLLHLGTVGRISFPSFFFLKILFVRSLARMPFSVFRGPILPPLSMLTGDHPLHFFFFLFLCSVPISPSLHPLSSPPCISGTISFYSFFSWYPGPTDAYIQERYSIIAVFFCSLKIPPRGCPF